MLWFIDAITRPLKGQIAWFLWEYVWCPLWCCHERALDVDVSTSNTYMYIYIYWTHRSIFQLLSGCVSCFYTLNPKYGINFLTPKTHLIEVDREPNINSVDSTESQNIETRMVCTIFRPVQHPKICQQKHVHNRKTCKGKPMAHRKVTQFSHHQPSQIWISWHVCTPEALYAPLQQVLQQHYLTDSYSLPVQSLKPWSSQLGDFHRSNINILGYMGVPTDSPKRCWLLYPLWLTRLLQRHHLRHGLEPGGRWRGWRHLKIPCHFKSTWRNCS